MSANRFATDVRVRAGLALAIVGACVAIVLYQVHHRRQLLAYTKANTAHAKHTALTARAFLRKYQSTQKKTSEKCSQDCLTALWLVAETKDILTQYKNDRKKGYEVLYKHRARLRNPATQDYPFVIERKRLHGETHYSYKAHGNKRLLHLSMHDVQTILDKELCPSETCKMQPIMEAYYRSTNLKNKRYTTLRYAWYDPITGNETFKESIVCRFDKDTIIGAGYTVQVHEEIPDIPLVATCVTLYGLLLLYIFVLPGTLYAHSDAALVATPTLRWAFPTVFVVGVIWLMYRHSNTLSVESSLNETIIYNQTQTKRIVAGTLAAMALSFTFIQRTYKTPVVKLALFTAIVLSILAFVDVVSDTDRKGGDEERGLMVNYHVTSTFVTCSIVMLIWLFTFLVCQTQ